MSPFRNESPFFGDEFPREQRLDGNVAELTGAQDPHTHLPSQGAVDANRDDLPLGFASRPLVEKTDDTAWPKISGGQPHIHLGARLGAFDGLEKALLPLAEDRAMPKASLYWYRLEEPKSIPLEADRDQGRLCSNIIPMKNTFKVS